MNALFIDIHETVVRALIMQDDAPVYTQRFRLAGFAGRSEQDSTLPGLELPEILQSIRRECGCAIDTAHLILPPEQAVVSRQSTPRLPLIDAEKIIRRKLVAETKEEFPPFSIVAGAADQKSQNWTVVYVPTATIRSYRRLFSSNKLKLKSITTPVNAMLDAFRGVREAIFNSHAIFEIIGNSIEAYYITADGILHSERMPCFEADSQTDGISAETLEKSLKQRLFKIIDTIFRINSHYQTENPHIPVQLAWICGDTSGLDQIAEALKEAMSIDVAIAPAMPSAIDNASVYVPLIGLAESVLNGSTITYAEVDFFHRFPLQKTYGIAVYAIATIAALLVFVTTEREYRSLRHQVAPLAQQSAKNKPATSSPAYLNALTTMQKLTAQQFAFYSLFRELANQLPVGVRLEKIDYNFKNDTGVITTTALVPLGSQVAATELPGQLMAMFDRSPSLRNHREPAISTVVKDAEMFLKITFSSEVKPFDTTN